MSRWQPKWLIRLGKRHTIDQLLDEVPLEWRPPFHGTCAIVSALKQALEQGEDLRGMVYTLALVRPDGDPRDSARVPPCGSCLQVLLRVRASVPEDAWRGTTRLHAPLHEVLAKAQAMSRIVDDSSMAPTTSRLEEWQRELAGFRLFPGAREVLAQFGGIKIREQGPGLEAGREPVHLLPTLCALGEEEFEEAAKRLDVPLYPLGEYSHEAARIAMAEDGRVFILRHDIWLAGMNFPDALERMVYGRVMPIMTSRFPMPVVEVLMRAGWWAGRTVPHLVGPWLESSRDLSASEKALIALQEFGGLRIPVQISGSRGAQGILEVNPTLLTGPMKRLCEFPIAVGQGAYPVGIIDRGRLLVGIGVDGRTVVAGEGQTRWAPTFEAALEALVSGKELAG